MKPVFKPLLPALLCTALCACSGNGAALNLGIGGFGRHLGLGTSVSLPIGGKTQDAAALPDDAADKIIARFAADGSPADAPVKGGSYRRLISKRGDAYLVQDFYEDGGSKRTDPMLLARDALPVRDAAPADGTLTVYDRDGTPLRQQIYRDGKPLAQ